MTDRHGLKVDAQLAAFVEQAALPGTGVDAGTFWAGFAAAVADLGPKNRALLARREDLQAQIDAWHLARRGTAFAPAEYRAFLTKIGYLEPEG
ncbi:MAG: malate synthase G, partial [Paracoccaceae bacterium]|nr:malate synthase G [Paracoccaceae bacterium]